MPVIAITREVSAAINSCELSFHERQPIDLARARLQHEAYRECLRAAGAQVVSLGAEDELPDAVFVEDTTVAVGEVAVMARMGAASRRAEVESMAAELARYRPLEYVRAPATLDGGDVLIAGRTLYVGLSARTNRDGFEQLKELLRPFGYVVMAVEVSNCLHLKSAVSYLGEDTLILNRDWIAAETFAGYKIVEVTSTEPGAANILKLGDDLIMPAAYTETRELLEKKGFSVSAVDVSELQKAEAGVTCCSVILENFDASNSGAA